MRMLLRGAALLCAGVSALAAQADSVRPSNQPAVGPPIRRIATASAVSKERIGSILGVRELPDGRVLVNDGQSRRLLLMDTMLVTERVVLDSMSEQANTYGTRQGTLLALRGDSSLFIDPNSLALLVLDPAGNIARVRSVPRAQDVYTYGSNGGYWGVPGTDAKGRLVYRIQAEPARPLHAPPRGVPYFPQEPDSAFIVALNIDTRKLDTLGSIRTPFNELIVRLNPGGGFNVNSAINPMPSTDEWAVLSDGSVAFVRSIDYRIEFLNPDGSLTSTPKLAYDWQPMTDSAKQRLVDSVRTAQARQQRNQFTNAVIRWVNTYGKKYPPNFTAPEGFVPQQGFAKDWKYPPGVNFPANYIYACAPGVEPTIEGATGGAPGAGNPSGDRAAAVAATMLGGMPGVPPEVMRDFAGAGRPSCIPQPIPNLAQVPNPPTMREVAVVNPKRLPDFRPPFGQGAVRADLDGNLWIRINLPTPNPRIAVYDVVSREGQLVDRIQLPPNYNLVGFGRGKVVFLSMRDQAGIHLARVRLK